MKKIKDWEGEFFDKLAEKLERLFPKTNQDNPEIPSESNRTTAFFYVLADKIFKDILEKALAQQRQEIIEEIDKIIKKQEELSDKEMKMVYMPYREFGIGLLYYLKQKLTE